MPRQYNPSHDSAYNSSSPPNLDTLGGRWQTSLEDYCTRKKFQPPTFSLFSDRRGGRTAWSSSVIVQGRKFAARYWYDGAFVNNAQEDAAEVALIVLDPSNHQALATTTDYSGQLYPQQSHQRSL